MLLLACGVTRHRVDRGFDGLPEIVFEESRHARLSLARPLTRQGQRITSQVARVDQPREKRVQNDERLPFARCSLASQRRATVV